MTRLTDLLAAAERVLSGHGADGMPPETHADARALAEFVRELLAHGPTGYVNTHTKFGGHRVVEIVGDDDEEFVAIEAGAAWPVAADLLRAVERAERGR